jgi:hypothetical protein
MLLHAILCRGGDAGGGGIAVLGLRQLFAVCHSQVDNCHQMCICATLLTDACKVS